MPNLIINKETGDLIGLSRNSEGLEVSVEIKDKIGGKIISEEIGVTEEELKELKISS